MNYNLESKMQKLNLFFYFSLIVFILGSAFFLNAIFTTKHNHAYAASTQSLGGYAWSDTIGWISFNGTCGNSCTYGVTIDDSTGDLSGYGWSSNVGWVKFGGLSGFPSGSGTSATNAKYTGTSFNGWALVVSGTGRTDGWDGWISLKGTNYGVTTSNTDVPGIDGAKYLTGYAWGSEVVGWVDMEKVFINNGALCANPINGICPDTNPPGKPNITLSPDATCRVTIDWTITPDPSPATTFELIRDGSTKKTGISYDIRSTIDDTGGLVAGGTYSYQIKAKNSVGENTSNPQSVTLAADCVPGAYPPSIGTFKAVPSAVNNGGSCNLAWTDIRNISVPTGDTCKITGPGFTPAYSLTSSDVSNSPGSHPSPAISASSQYVLTCVNSSGAVSKTTMCNLKPGFIEF